MLIWFFISLLCSIWIIMIMITAHILAKILLEKGYSLMEIKRRIFYWNSVLTLLGIIFIFIFLQVSKLFL